MLSVAKKEARLIVAWGLLLLSAVGLEATTVRAPEFDQLVKRADRIVHGTVTATRAFWDEYEGRKLIRTEVSVRAVRTIGKPLEEGMVTLRFLGGQVDDMIMNVAGMPNFASGDEVVLFERGNGHSVCPLVGWKYGHYRVSRKADGSDPTVRRSDFSPLLEVQAVTLPLRDQPGRVNALNESKAGMDLDAFLQRVAELRGGGQSDE